MSLREVEQRHRAVPAEGTRPVGMLRAIRADRSLMALLPAIVVVDLVYRQLYTTVPSIIATGYALVGAGFALFGLPGRASGPAPAA